MSATTPITPSSGLPKKLNSPAPVMGARKDGLRSAPEIVSGRLMDR
ncbi:MAG: hypothetical protein ACRELG_02215 [Gemmataceae bacterium]